MKHFNKLKSEIVLYHTVELLQIYISFTGCYKVYIRTGVHYVR